MLETKNEEEFSLIREVAVLLTSSIYRQVLLNALSYMREKRQTKIEEEASGSFLLRPLLRDISFKIVACFGKTHIRTVERTGGWKPGV